MNQGNSMSESKISERARRCLRRIDAGKSIPDFEAMDELEEKGMVTCKAEDGEFEIRVTEAGRAYLGDEYQGKRA